MSVINMENRELQTAWNEFLVKKFSPEALESLIDEFDQKVQGRGREYEITEDDVEVMLRDLDDISHMVTVHYDY